MSQFSDLYGPLLDIELGSEDRSQLFTTQRRKDAINFAQREFVRLTRCFTKLGTIPMSDGVAEYDLEATLTDFLGLDPRREVVIKRVDGSGKITFLSGRSFEQRSKEELDIYNDGWRSASKGTPVYWYLEEDGGTFTLGVTPPPKIDAGHTWTLVVPHILRPTDMSADADKPFTVGGDAKNSLELYHQALVHRAAAQLEVARKNYVAAERQMKLFAGYVADYLQAHRTGTNQITIARNYFAETRRGERAADPRR